MVESLLDELIRVSRVVGADPDWVQGGGGNTSVKSEDGATMLVKASGTTLAEMDATKGWAELDLSVTRQIVEKPELAGLYRGAAALVWPSRYEGFGIPVLEAMASGTPVVLSSDPALREVAGDAGVYAENGDYAGAIRRALDDRDRFARAGIERARAFSCAESARRTADVYRKVLA